MNRGIISMEVDKLGRRIVFFIGMIIFIVSTFSYAIISSIGLLLIFRFIHGFGWGSSSTSNDTIATDNIPKERFGEGMGFFSLSSSLAMAIGPAVGLYITTNYNFNILFYISAIVAILSFLLSFSVKHNKIEIKEKKESKNLLELFEKTSISPSIMVLLLAVLLTRPVFGKIIDKHGFDYTIIPGMILVIISMVLLSLASTLTIFLVTALVYCIGFDSGIGVGAIVYGYLASNFGYSIMYFLSIVPVIIAFILYFFVRRKIVSDKPST